MPQLVTSLIRTLVPWVVGYLLALAAKAGLDLPEGLATELVTVALGGVYYLVVRILETRGKAAFGWLLGAPKAPTYDATAKVDDSSPTGESAATASPLPDGTPVKSTRILGKALVGNADNAD